jgi:endonuclease-3 related protein
MHGHFGDQHWWPGESPLEVLIGAVLTQNTAWSNVATAIRRLKAQGLLHAGRLHAAGPAGIAPHIRSAGYFNVKARRLWNLLDWFVHGYQASFDRLETIPTPRLRQELLAVSGIGPETADSILLYALHRGIFVIDAYTRRVLTRHHLATTDASYAQLQQLMTRHLPADTALFNEYHAQIVMVGKHFCKPAPRCADCPLRVYLPSVARDLKPGAPLHRDRAYTSAGHGEPSGAKPRPSRALRLRQSRVICRRG